MVQRVYIKVRDCKNNYNVWRIIEEVVIAGTEMFKIHSRDTYAYIEKSHCFCECGSTLLYYEKGDCAIDIADSNVEIETKKERRQWKIEQSRNINPFKVFDKVDFGYMEDVLREGDWDL